MYRLTLRELYFFAEGRKKANRGERRQRVELVWLGDMLRRKKKLPQLDTLLPNEPVVLSPQKAGEKLLGLVPMLTSWGARKEVHKKKGKKK